MHSSSVVRLLKSSEAPAVDIGSFGARFLINSAEAAGRFSLIEHWVPPYTLAAPLHRHSREDEFSLVLHGRLGVQLDDRLVTAETGDVVFKPREQWHTFWNPGDTECRLVEIITPGGFEEMFKEMAADPAALTGEAAAALDARYGLEVDYQSIERLCHELRLSFPG